jgi:hypothetical protein
MFSIILIVFERREEMKRRLGIAGVLVIAISRKTNPGCPVRKHGVLYVCPAWVTA